MRSALLSLILLSGLGCGDDDTVADTGTDTRPADAATDSEPSDASGDAEPDPMACDMAVADGVCATEGQNCGACTDICRACSLLRCNEGRWRAVERPARCFSCGTRQCVRDEQYCEETIPGVPGESSRFDCQPRPDTCTAALTCDCLDFDDCDDTGDGVHVRVALP